MTAVRLVLVRHGRASAGWEEIDPGLDALGHRQAAAMADGLAPFGPLPIVTSPLRRTRETAAHLAARWGVPVTIDDAVAELPSPDGVAVAERVDWLRRAMAGSWSQMPERHRAWRDCVVSRIRRCDTAAVIVSHFVAINAVIGAALDDDRLVIASLDNCSCTLVDVEPGGRLTVIETGREADTLIR